MLHLPSTHTHRASAAKVLFCQSDTHLFFQLRKYHRVFCREHTPQPGTPTAAPGWSTGGWLRAPTPPREPAQPVWVGSPAPRQGRPACGYPAPHCSPARLRRVLHAEGGLCPRAPHGLLARSWLWRSLLLLRSVKARPARLAHVWGCPRGGQT